MSNAVWRTSRTGASAAALALLALPLLAVLAGCRKSDPGIPPEPEAKTFADHWQLVAADLVRVRVISTEPSPDAKKLAAFRDRIRDHIKAMRATASGTHEKDFLNIASSHLDNIRNQLDQAVRAAQANNGDEVDKAVMEIGFILDEMHRLVEMAGL